MSWSQRSENPLQEYFGTEYLNRYAALEKMDEETREEDEKEDNQVLSKAPCLRVEQPDVACPPELLAELEAALPHLSRKDISPGERVAMMNVFQEFQDVFALKSTELGRTNLVEHEIDVGTNSPMRLPPRRIPLHKVSAVEQALAEMEERR